MAGPRYRLDSTWRRPGDGSVVIAGSPLRLFRLSTGGAQVVAMLEAGEVPDTAAIHQLFDRFVQAGALHPEHECGPYTLADVTIVVPAYGAVPAHLTAQLEAHVAAGGAAIIVDDATPPGDENSVHVMAGRVIRTLRHDMNRGPGAARNTGLAEVTTPLVAFVDTDVELTTDWLRPLLAHFADEQVVLVAPRVAGRPADNWLAQYETRHSPLDLGDEPARIAPGTRVSYVPAAAIVCSTAAVRACGGFDEALRFGEDVDLVWRLTAADHRCRYEPASVVHHAPRETLAAMLRQRFGYGRSAAPLAQRHPGALSPVRMSGWSALVWLLIALRRPFLGIGVAVGTSAALVRKLRDVPPRESLRLAAAGHLAAGRQLATATVRVWWPIALLTALVVRRARLPLLGALLAAGTTDRDAPVMLVDQAAYGAGVWVGVWRERTLVPLLPEFRNWPRRGAD